ncbi:hypothetical protein Droror1_Dr00027984 [Drosera rotundifolia]
MNRRSFESGKSIAAGVGTQRRNKICDEHGDGGVAVRFILFVRESLRFVLVGVGWDVAGYQVTALDNEEKRQSKADVSVEKSMFFFDRAGYPIILPRESESVLLGAAILGASAAKKYPSLHEAMKALNVAGQFLPGLSLRVWQGWICWSSSRKSASRRRCSRYHIDHNDGGKASVTTFVVDLLGFLDNVHYDGEGHYWIATTSALPPFFYKTFQSRLFRKVYGIVKRYIGLQRLMEGNGGAFGVDLQGKRIATFYDPNLAITTSDLKVGRHIYRGSLNYQHIVRISLPSQPDV